MPRIGEMFGKYLKQDDITQPTLATIDSVDREEIKSGDHVEQKWVVRFREIEKPLVLNLTNAEIIAEVCKSEDTDEWLGKRVVIYVDPSVMFGGKKVGGLRMRGPKPGAKLPEPPPPPSQDDDSQIPF